MYSVDVNLDHYDIILSLVEIGYIEVFINQQIFEEFIRNQNILKENLINCYRIDTSKVKLILGEKPKELAEINRKIGDALSEKISRIDNIFSRLSYERTKLTTTSIEKAKTRHILGNPPGKSTHTIGDEVNWESFLEFIEAKECKGCFYILTNDNDYIKNQEFLRRECYALPNLDILSFKIAFNKSAKDFIDELLKSNQKELKEIAIRNLATSGSFYETDRLFFLLSRIDSISYSDMENIAKHTISNSQVWGAVINWPRLETLNFLINNKPESDLSENLKTIYERMENNLQK